MASHVRYTSVNGDALASATTYSLILGLIPVLLLVATVLSWADPGTVADAADTAARRVFPTEVTEVVTAAAGDLDRRLTWVAVAIIGWLSVRSVRALRTGCRAVCGQRSGSGNPISDNLRDVGLAIVLFGCAAVGVVIVAEVPSTVAARVLGVPVLFATLLIAMRILPWPDTDRPTLRRTASAAAAATVAITALGTVGGLYLHATMSGRDAVFGVAATLVATSLWIALSVRAVLRALSVAAVLEAWHRPAPADDRALWVIVPAYQEASGIGATLDALARQSDLEFALVVGDNGSTDRTPDVVREFGRTAPFPVHLVVDDERGVGCAVDAAARFAIAHGAELLARTDADARPRPGWVAGIRDRFARGADVVCGASIPRRDEDPSVVERWLLPAVQRILAVYGRHRGPHRGPEFLAPYVLTHGHSFAITSAVYEQAGGAVRRPLEAGPEDVHLLNRARQITPNVVRAEEVVVENSLRRLREWGMRRTLLWYWDRRYTPPTADQVHVRIPR
ncbi:YhjD/YihY/BrkB family envelope integrity protein [Williamsia sp.]|uniref:YhjD/YihY/BrkB family envelope integrity protein n=1 Tax=Williamsia sp. TaxID=1872085 RepID=UPI0025CD0C77|nr:YhjD/YihY/BrkB family envelope integrity protein [Williamsia sp.]